MKLYYKKLTAKFDKAHHQSIRLKLSKKVRLKHKTPNSILYCRVYTVNPNRYYAKYRTTKTNKQNIRSH